MADQVLPQVGKDRMENTGKNLSLGRKGKETKLRTDVQSIGLARVFAFSAFTATPGGKHYLCVTSEEAQFGAMKRMKVKFQRPFEAEKRELKKGVLVWAVKSPQTEWLKQQRITPHSSEG